MNYLLEISIGPVQDFISAARRTRDLWFGSMLLSELAKAVALKVKEEHGELIFPAPSNNDELKPNSDLSVANIILAEFKDIDSEKLEAVSDNAYKAAKARLKEYADKVFEIMQDFIVKDRYYAQIDDVIEFYSAWGPINNDYHSARKNVARLLAARKNIRDFQQSAFPDNVPKSSLDGLRESVLIRNEKESELSKLPNGVKIKPNEALDAIGLIKRVPTGNDQRFKSLSRVAFNTWERGKGRVIIQDPYFQKQYQKLLSEDDLNSETISNFLGNDFLGKYMPDAPYIAFICADGDKMGAALSTMKSADEHREFSRNLSSFAGEAEKVINEYNGSCIYTGGDDVMAFLPLDKALPCARELHDLFGKIMGQYGASLSVGVSIAHSMENLAQLLQYGRDAESIAKKGINNSAIKECKDRNGLAISIRSRGNIPFTVREQWRTQSEGEELFAMSLDERIARFAGYFKNNEIPTKFPYELRENAKFYRNWSDAELLKNAVISDVIRVFNRKDVTLTPDEKEMTIEYIKLKVFDAKTICALADELILAQWIGAALKQAESN